jgi:hypothetical protein
VNAAHTLALAAALLLTACGNSDTPATLETAPNVAPEAAPIITEQSTAQAGDDRIGATVLVLPLPGPVLQLDRPALVRVQLTGQLLQAAHYGARLSSASRSASPPPRRPAACPPRWRRWPLLPCHWAIRSGCSYRPARSR